MLTSKVRYYIKRTWGFQKCRQRALGQQPVSDWERRVVVLGRRGGVRTPGHYFNIQGHLSFREGNFIDATWPF